MPSIAARLVNLSLPLLGIKRFFAEPDKLPGRLAKKRRQGWPKPRAKLHRDFDITEDTSRGFPVLTITPKGGVRPGAPHLLYFHGGGYVMEVVPQHWDTVARLCAQLGASATVPIYPLAPEHKVVDILAAMRALYGDLAAEYGAERITMMGDSAGGGMTLALTQIVQADGGPLPGRLVLWSPWLDATVTNQAQRDMEHRDGMLSVAGLQLCGDMIRGELPKDHPHVSPLFGQLAGLPPMAVFAGTRDLLLFDSRSLSEKLSAMAVPHVYQEYPEMCHVWMLLPTPEGKQALVQTADFSPSWPALMRQVPGAPRWLGLAGVLPQLACLAYGWSGDGDWAEAARIAGGLYAGLILSFLGGTWWGIAAAAPAAEGRGVLGWVWVAAVLPSLIAFGAGLWWMVRPDQPQQALWVLGGTIVLSPLVDMRLRRMALAPHWWLALRWPLSLLLGLATLALAVR